MIDHLKNTYDGLIDTLESAPSLDGYLVGVWPYYNYNAPIHNGKITLFVIPGDTSGETPITNESSNSDILPTTFGIIIQTKLQKDEDAFKSEFNPTLLDFEFMVHQALQSSSYWGTDGDNHGWEIARIVRDELYFGADGAFIPEVRQTLIELTVDISYDREDGPAR